MVAATVIVAELFISNSRSAMLAVYASTAFIMVTHPKTWKFFLYGSAAIVLALFLLSSVPIFDLIIQNIFRLQTGLSGRTYLWTLAFDYVIAHPFLGIGPGWFYERLIFDAPPMANILQMSSGSLSTHNSFLMIATDLGIFALLILLFMISFFFYRSFKLWTRLKNGPDFPLLVALCALMIALIIRALFETDFIMMHAYVTENLPFLIPLAIQDRLYAREFSTA